MRIPLGANGPILKRLQLQLLDWLGGVPKAKLDKQEQVAARLERQLVDARAAVRKADEALRHG